MQNLKIVVSLVLLSALAVGSYRLIGVERVSAQARKTGASPSGLDAAVPGNSERVRKEGQHTFRFDTFGDEAWWGDTLRLHEAIEGARFGGIGPGVSPATALSLGLKVDLDALPQSLVQQIKMGKVNLNDPAITLALLQLKAVVGVTGHFNSDGSLKSVGIQCALCHSTVDNALAPGIGHLLDGWANRDLNVGAIIAAAPNLQPIADLLSTDQATVRKALNSWGPGKFDAELLLDGKAFRPDGKPAATLIPPAFGLAGINLHTWTGWGSVPHWNALVANLEMHGKGDFYDSRVDDAAQFPIAAANHFGHVQNSPDLITAKLPALHLYQLLIPAPALPSSSFDHTAADRGRELFSGKAKCSTCHADPVFTEPGWNMHKASEVCVDDFQANRAPDHAYRTTPLNGLWTHTKGGFYHDGRFATLADVVNHYDACFSLGLTAREQGDVVEYMKSLPRHK
jgi:hypothetical protein